MGQHRPAPAPRPGAKLGATLAATAALVAVPMTGEMPAAQAHVVDPGGPGTDVQPAADVAPAASSEAAQSVYTVKKGDTLSKIGAALGVRWQDLAEANGIAAPFVILIGQNLTVPGDSSSSAAPSTPAPAGATSAVSKAIQVAMDQLGDRYVYGAAGPSAFDCSGLVQFAFAAAGVSLPHSSLQQSRLGVAVSRADLRPGDLVFYYSPVSHVGIYLGDGQVLQASSSAYPVHIKPIDWVGTPTAYRRVA